jgi:RimJ/RimL family protein N-acetyltransferase
VTVVDAISIRPVRVDDAEALVAHARAIAADPEGFSPAAPDETRTVDEQRKLLEEVCADPRVLLLVAERAGSGGIVGEASLRLVSRLRATSHARVFGITLARAVRRRGVGTRMMQTAIDWAREHGVRRIELATFANNAPALALYRKLGFEVEGVRKGSLVLNGRVVDDVVMALLLE